jgi:hypothetical protein
MDITKYGSSVGLQSSLEHQVCLTPYEMENKDANTDQSQIFKSQSMPLYAIKMSSAPRWVFYFSRRAVGRGIIGTSQL